MMFAAFLVFCSISSELGCQGVSCSDLSIQKVWSGVGVDKIKHVSLVIFDKEVGKNNGMQISCHLLGFGNGRELRMELPGRIGIGGEHNLELVGFGVHLLCSLSMVRMYSSWFWESRSCLGLLIFVC